MEWEGMEIRMRRGQGRFKGRDGAERMRDSEGKSGNVSCQQRQWKDRGKSRVEEVQKESDIEEREVESEKKSAERERHKSVI